MFHRTQHNNPFLFTPRIQGMEFGDNGSGAETTAAVEDICGVNGGGPGDDLFVDELLDFSNGFSETEGTPEEPPENGSAGSGNDAPPPPDNFSLSTGDDFGSLHESELSIQGETLESLEWLSHFVEDPLPDYSLAGKFTPGPAANHSKLAAPEERHQRFVIPGLTKARTKRARTGGRIRPVLSPSSSSSSSTTTLFSPPKKPKRNPADGGGGAAALRRCTHCGVTKTPQWRAGPFGPKSLCNACGVRHKSGRLLPEYRPACSPTFSTELHSNNHRKVLEMRRKKEAETAEAGGGGSGSGSELLV